MTCCWTPDTKRVFLGLLPSAVVSVSFYISQLVLPAPPVWLQVMNELAGYLPPTPYPLPYPTPSTPPDRDAVAMSLTSPITLLFLLFDLILILFSFLKTLSRSCSLPFSRAVQSVSVASCVCWYGFSSAYRLAGRSGSRCLRMFLSHLSCHPLFFPPSLRTRIKMKSCPLDGRSVLF